MRCCLTSQNCDLSHTRITTYLYPLILFQFNFYLWFEDYISSLSPATNRMKYNKMERVSDCCLTLDEHFFHYIMARTSYI